MISIIYFFIILSALVIVHELGHFLVSKYFNIRVDEFGLGYPPRAAKLFVWKKTLFTLNWLPFGGFVKIFGENPNIEDLEPRDPIASSADKLRLDSNSEDSSDSFQSKNRGIQASVLVAGVVFNFLFAWILISAGFMSGLPMPLGQEGLPVQDAHTVITTVVEDSPASRADLKSGDTLVGLSSGGTSSKLDPESAARFISESQYPVEIVIRRGDETITKIIDPSVGIVEGKKAIGVAMDTIGTVKLSFGESLQQGFKTAYVLTIETAKALALFLSRAITGHANFSEVTGPVGLVGMVGDVRSLGFIYLVSFTALISINLAVVNLLPIPALDGGRLLFVAIELVIRRPISPKIFNYANNIGFFLLLVLMAVITFRDIVHLI
jgi:regulator of sigma E protease